MSDLEELQRKEETEASCLNVVQPVHHYGDNLRSGVIGVRRRWQTKSPERTQIESLDACCASPSSANPFFSFFSSTDGQTAHKLRYSLKYRLESWINWNVWVIRYWTPNSSAHYFGFRVHLMHRLFLQKLCFQQQRAAFLHQATSNKTDRTAPCLELNCREMQLVGEGWNSRNFSSGVAETEFNKKE